MQRPTVVCKRGLPESKKFISELSEFTSQCHNCVATSKRLLLTQEFSGAITILPQVRVAYRYKLSN